MDLPVTAGHRLRNTRESRKLTLRDVEIASERIANKYSSDEYLLSSSRISDFETKNIVPNVHKLYAFAVIYDLNYLELLTWYGVDLSRAKEDAQTAPAIVTRRTESYLGTALKVPIRLDPGFSPSVTSNFARFIEQWGTLPAAYLQQLVKRPFTYVRIGDSDRTMYPLIVPGSFVQVDESKGYIINNWRSEYERPIYLIETREELVCCWCEVQGAHIVLQSHPLSHVPVRMMNYPQDAEILGVIVGIAMNFSQPESGSSESER